MQHSNAEILEILHQMIGTRGIYHETEYELIEVLEQDLAVVLADCTTAHTIQPDMHGEAKRLVHKTHTVSLLSETNHDLHPVLIDFFGVSTIAELISKQSKKP